MATISKNWQSASQIVGTSDAFENLSATEIFSSYVNMVTNGYEGCHLIVEIDYAGSNDEVEINLYGSLDGSNSDDTPIWTIQGDSSQDPQQLSFIIKDLAYFRIGLVQTGSTDTHQGRAYVREWNYSSTA